MTAAQCLHLTHFFNNTITVWKPGRTVALMSKWNAESPISGFLGAKMWRSIKLDWLPGKWVIHWNMSLHFCLHMDVVLDVFALWQSSFSTRNSTEQEKGTDGSVPSQSFGLFFTALMELLSRTVISFSFVVQVESRDTLNSIALKFDTTPNKLVQLNKLFSRAVVPGQVWALVHAVTLHHTQITTSYRHRNQLYIL